MIDNVEKPGLTQLWSAASTPWQEELPWFFPTYERINNVENNSIEITDEFGNVLIVDSGDESIVV